MSWPLLATTIIALITMACLFISVVSVVISRNEIWTRKMGCFSDLKADCRTKPQRWAAAVHKADARWRGAKEPSRAFAFADYSLPSKVDCEGSFPVLDYGVAVGYASPGSPMLSFQVSYVLRSEPITNEEVFYDGGRLAILDNMTKLLLSLSHADPAFAEMIVEAPFISSEAKPFFEPSRVESTSSSFFEMQSEPFERLPEKQERDSDVSQEPVQKVCSSEEPVCSKEPVPSVETASSTKPESAAQTNDRILC